jgi:hypothetical protein
LRQMENIKENKNKGKIWIQEIMLDSYLN